MVRVAQGGKLSRRAGSEDRDSSTNVAVKSNSVQYDPNGSGGYLRLKKEKKKENNMYSTTENCVF